MSKKAFTLLELIIVLVIISILVSLAIPRYQRAVEKARASEGVRILGALREAQIRYYEQNDTFADSLSDLDVKIENLQYFQTPTVNSSDPIAEIIQEDNLYTLKIYENGNICCQGEACSYLGFSSC
jgi:prepilin-type N-terminal cleavage/methylation domain-containing protein